MVTFSFPRMPPTSPTFARLSFGVYRAVSNVALFMHTHVRCGWSGREREKERARASIIG